MTQTRGFRFIVEATFRIPSRTYVLAVGTLQHGVVHMRDEIQLQTPDGQKFPGVVEQIEMHTLPGKQTLGVGGAAAEHLAVGAVIASASEPV